MQMGHLNDRWNVKFDGVMVKDLTVKQIRDLLTKDLSQFDDEVLRIELAGRHADTQGTQEHAS
jgi:hypothetical protein